MKNNNHISQSIQRTQHHKSKESSTRTKSRIATKRQNSIIQQQSIQSNLQTIQFNSQFISLPNHNTDIKNNNKCNTNNNSNNNNNNNKTNQYTTINNNNTTTIITTPMKRTTHRPATSYHNNINDNYNNNRRNTTIATTCNNNSSSNNNVHHLTQLRKANLINVLSSKSPEQRRQKEINIIVQSLKYKLYFQSVVGNVKLMEEMAQEMGYLGCKQGETKTIDVDELRDKCFVVIMGCVEVLVQKQQQGIAAMTINDDNDNKIIDNVLLLTEQQQPDNNNDNLVHEQLGFWSATQCTQLEKLEKKENKTQNKTVLNQEDEKENEKDQQSNQQQPPKLKLLQIINQGQSLTYSQIDIPITTRLIHLHASITTHILTISNHHNDAIIIANKAHQTKKLIDFLSNLQLFKHVYRYSIESFIQKMTEVQYQYKGCLFRENDRVQCVYVVKCGEFALKKTVDPNHSCSKNNDSTKISSTKSVIRTAHHHNDQITSLRRQQHNYRQAQIKNITTGEIVGDSEAYLKIQSYTETCQCISQSATVYKIEKRDFLEKLLSSENNLPQIKKYLNLKYKNKLKQILLFMDKQLNNQTIARIWPASKSCDRKLKAVKSININQDRPSTGIKPTNETSSYEQIIQPNFFDEFNRTIPKNKQRKRINYKLTLNLSKQHRNIDSIYQMRQQQLRCKTQLGDFDSHFRSLRLRTVQTNRQQVKQISQKEKLKRKSFQTIEPKNIQSFHTDEEIPSCIKDIVGMVNCKEQYFKTRNKSVESQTEVSFHFETHKIPRFIEQKYKHLFMRLKTK